MTELETYLVARLKRKDLGVIHYIIEKKLKRNRAQQFQFLPQRQHMGGSGWT